MYNVLKIQRLTRELAAALVAEFGRAEAARLLKRAATAIEREEEFSAGSAMTFSAEGEFSAADAQIAVRILALCSQFQLLRHAFECNPDPLIIAEKMQRVDMGTLNEAHAWLTKLIVERYAIERITLDTGKFARPSLSTQEA